jgi:FkbM family methyltransferase
MVKFFKGLAFNWLGIENYLRLLQRGYFWAYRCGILKNNPDYQYHYFVKKLIKKGDVVIDIGANLGYYSKLFSGWVGKTGKVYAIEPIKLYNKIFLEATKKRKNICLLPYALGLEEKKVKLVTSPQTGYLCTGLPHIYDAGKDGDLDKQEFSFDAEMKIPSRLFADFKQIQYIKCDIEGFENVVLTDMKELIRKHKPIVQVEVWKQNEEDIFHLFSTLGYVAYKIASGHLSTARFDLLKTGDFIFIHTDNHDYDKWIKG